ncbi:MAG: hypothetical protein SPLM_10690 [Spiroplasma phoeniceum]|uniref:spiroplasma phage ORF1-like family protein n=1 Tax=Spiroplasma phoeniceum TaxID=47835 RepID=UPI003133FC63
MKKLLSILGTIGLTVTSTTSLISCEKPNNNENGGDNKPEPTPEPKKRQQPPKNSNWKLDNNPNFINYKVDNKWYIAIFRNNTKDWYIIIFLNNSGNDKILGKFSFDGVSQNLYLSDLRNYFKNGNVKTVYYWNNTNKPQTPTINKTIGEITDWSVENQNKVKDFLNLYLDVIIQENIRIQQGGNPDYDSLIVGTQRIIFNFEIVDESERYTVM